MNLKAIKVFLISLIFLLTTIVSSSANTLCNDGTFSQSTGKGTCSWHGGIAGGSKGNTYKSPSQHYKNQFNNDSRLPSYGSNSRRNNSFGYDSWNTPSYGSNSRRNNSLSSNDWNTNSWTTDSWTTDSWKW